MNWITLVLVFLVLYLVMSHKPAYSETDEKKIRVSKSLDALKDRSQNWMSASVDTLRALYDSVTSMATSMVKPQTSGFCAPCAAGVILA